MLETAFLVAFCFVLGWKRCFWFLFICWGGGDVVSDCFWFVGRGETVFLDFRGVSWEEKHGFLFEIFYCNGLLNNAKVSIITCFISSAFSSDSK